jgi:hypothetical protein
MKNLDFEYSIEHLVYQIENASLRLYPSPHIYINEAFPDFISNKIKKIFPDENSLIKMQ